MPVWTTKMPPICWQNNSDLCFLCPQKMSTTSCQRPSCAKIVDEMSRIHNSRANHKSDIQIVYIYIEREIIQGTKFQVMWKITSVEQQVHMEAGNFSIFLLLHLRSSPGTWTSHVRPFVTNVTHMRLNPKNSIIQHLYINSLSFNKLEKSMIQIHPVFTLVFFKPHLNSTWEHRSGPKRNFIWTNHWVSGALVRC